MKFPTIMRLCFCSALLLVATTVISTNFVHAQNEYEILDEFGTTQAANLFVDAITLDSREYSTGDVISGTFSLFNVGMATADAVRFRAHIISTEVSGVDYFPRDILFSSPISEAFSLEQGSVEKRFGITIPEYIPADTTFAVYIEAYINDEVTTYEYKPTIIEGNTIDFVSYQGALYIEDEVFSFLEGPTVLEDEVVTLELDVTGGNQSTTLLPVVTIFKGPSTDVAIDTIQYGSFAITSGSTVAQSFALPVAYDPGVYTASLVFLNEQGNVVSTQLIMRYVLDGLQPNIHAVTFNELDQNIINSFVVFLEYADTPINARLDSNGDFIDPRAASVFVKEGEEPFVAEQYDLLSSVSATVSISDAQTGRLLQTRSIADGELNPLAFDFDPLENVSRVVITAELFIDGEKVDEYITTVTVTPRYVSDKGNTVLLYGIFTGLAVLIIFIIVLLVIKRLQTTKQVEVAMSVENKEKNYEK